MKDIRFIFQQDPDQRRILILVLRALKKRGLRRSKAELVREGIDMVIAKYKAEGFL